MADMNKTINKLLQALNSRGQGLLYNRKQFMGKEGQPHTLYTISRAYWDESKGKYGSRELYKTTSTVRIALYLRDLWYLEEGRELPTDNEIWNKLREQINAEEM